MESAPQAVTPSTEWVHVTGNPAGDDTAPGESTPVAETSPGENNYVKESPPAKRRKEERERTRVSRACDRCKKKKTRCSGRCPCALCLKAGLPCEFTASYTRGRLPSVIVDEAAMTASTRPRVSMPATISTPSASPKGEPPPSFRIHRPPSIASPPPIYPRGTDDVFPRPASHLTVPTDNTQSISGRNSPEPLQTDQQGHYVGPASGVSFLLRIQKRLHQTTPVVHNSDSTIFTFGDAPLPEHDPTFFVLPPKPDAQRLVERYFDFAAPTHRFLHRPTIEALLEEFYDTQGEMRLGTGKGGKEEAPAKRALLLIVFAQAQAYMPAKGNGGEDDQSSRYYFASEHQLSKERGAVRLSSVQARLGQCFYLLSQSRINHCWSLFGTMAHLAFAIGLNRGRRCDPSATVDYVELESRRRLFWVAYTLDKYLAAALGRPRTFKDEDIDQELPTIVNDNDLHPNNLIPASTKSYEIPIMMAPVEHIKLSRILGLVLRDLYPIRPPSLPLRLELSAKYTADLHAWRANLTRFVDATELPSSLLIPIYQRQRNVLNLAYYHTLLLVHRPFLLSNFASLTRIDANGAGLDGRNGVGIDGGKIDTSLNVQMCLDAAMGIARVIDEMKGGQIFRAFWFTQYYAFCAVVVLYIYRIQQGIVEPGKCEGYFSAGQRCQAVLQGISDTDCLARRYCLVLEELRLEAVRYQGNKDGATVGTDVAASPTASNLGAHNLDVPPPSLTPQRDASPAFTSTPYYPNNLPTPESVVFNTNFLPTSSIMADLTSWGQFDSLVNAGIGMLDGGFQGDGGLGLGFGT